MLAHVALLTTILFHHPKPVDLTPTWLAWGNAEHSYKVTYWAGGGGLDTVVLPASSVKRPRQGKRPSTGRLHHQLDANAEEGAENTKAGLALGTVVDGPISGHEVHVAYPVVYPDPPVNRAELPRDLAGDVVIEVTIDSEGNVVETKIVQAIGHGIDEKIEATLRRWHYQPATLDGTPVASHHDVHFHFPS